MGIFISGFVLSVSSQPWGLATKNAPHAEKSSSVRDHSGGPEILCKDYFHLFFFFTQARSKLWHAGVKDFPRQRGVWGAAGEGVRKLNFTYLDNFWLCFNHYVPGAGHPEQEPQPAVDVHDRGSYQSSGCTCENDQQEEKSIWLWWAYGQPLPGTFHT